jgi:transcriptional regulator with XRE-family HTH domain
MEIAKTIRGEIARKNTTKARVAEATGLSPAQMGRYVRGASRFDVEELDAICWALGLDTKTVIVDADSATSGRHLDPDWNIESIK